MDQNNKAKYLNYTIMFLVCLIVSTMYLPKILLDKLIKIVTYFKNQSLGINIIIAYKLNNYV